MTVLCAWCYREKESVGTECKNGCAPTKGKVILYCIRCGMPCDHRDGRGRCDRCAEVDRQ
jgi:hypothetical protein